MKVSVVLSSFAVVAAVSLTSCHDVKKDRSDTRGGQESGGGDAVGRGEVIRFLDSLQFPANDQFIPKELKSYVVLNQKLTALDQVMGAWRTTVNIRKYLEEVRLEPRWYFVDYNLIDIPDEGQNSVDMSDEAQKWFKKQAAINSGKFILVNKPLFDKMSAEDQADLIMHEALRSAIGQPPHQKTMNGMTLLGNQISEIRSLLFSKYLKSYSSDKEKYLLAVYQAAGLDQVEVDFPMPPGKICLSCSYDFMVKTNLHTTSYDGGSSYSENLFFKIFSPDTENTDILTEVPYFYDSITAERSLMIDLALDMYFPERQVDIHRTWNIEVPESAIGTESITSVDRVLNDRCYGYLETFEMKETNLIGKYRCKVITEDGGISRNSHIVARY